MTLLETIPTEFVREMRHFMVGFWKCARFLGRL